MSAINLVPETPAMAVDLANANLAAFADNRARRILLPDQSDEIVKRIQTWWRGNLDRAESHPRDPNEHSYALVDTTMPSGGLDNSHGGTIVGQGVWKLETGEVWEYSPETEMMPGCNPDAYVEFFSFINKLRNRNVGGKKLWHLTRLYTHPKYGGRGAGRVFVEWGTKQADEAGYDCYLDSTEGAKDYYEKFGFEVIDKGEIDLVPYGGQGVYTSYCMLRKPRTPAK